MDRKQETRIVKQALVEAGYTGVTVGHGTGTAYGWLHIGVNHRISYDKDYIDVETIAQRATGRHGEWGGCINIDVRGTTRAI